MEEWFYSFGYVHLHRRMANFASGSVEGFFTREYRPFLLSAMLGECRVPVAFAEDTTDGMDHPDPNGWSSRGLRSFRIVSSKGSICIGFSRNSSTAR